MRRLIALASVPAALLAGAPAASAAEVKRGDFRYTRGLAANGGGPLVFEPDGALFEHSAPGFADLRVLDASGQQVPWRPMPSPQGTAPMPADVLNAGRRGGDAVALLDMGAERRVRDRVELEIPQRDFVGRAVVLGADAREGPFTRLAGTGIYDIRGAEAARSTVAVFPASDFRYLQVRASGVERIAGATVSGTGERPRLLPRPPLSSTQAEDGSRSVITVDFGSRNLPIEELRVEADDRRYERPVRVLGSNDGASYVPVAAGRIFRFAGSRSAPIAIEARHRYLRIEVENRDDPHLGGLHVSAWSRSRALLVEGGRPGPYTVWYGNPAAAAPSYDFARLPAGALGVDRAVTGALEAEISNPAYEPPPDTRSFSARHPETVAGALALAALVLGAVGLLALRSRA